MSRAPLAAAALLAASFAACGPAAAEEGGAAAAPTGKEARLAAFDRGLDFLRARAAEGKWGVKGKPEPGITALVVTSFLERPGGAAEKDRAVVDGAVAWLLSLQKEDGGIYAQGNANYTTSLAMQALSIHGKEKHADVLARAAGFLRRMQFFEEGIEGRVVQKADLRYGGMGYGSDPTQPDLSNTQFALESLRAAGVKEDDPAFQRALTYLQRAQNRKENETEGEPASRGGEDGKVIVHASDGGATYRPFDSKAGNFERPDGKQEARSYGSMTYALLKCYLYAGLKPEDPRVKDAAKWVREHYTWEENPGFADPKAAQQGVYYYYATAARALDLLGEGAAGAGADGKPRDWRADLAAKLLSLQQADGSWANANDRWMEGVPEVATAFALKALGPAVR